MKFNKNTIQILSLLLAALSVMTIMLVLLSGTSYQGNTSTFSLFITAIIVMLTVLEYLLLIIKRTNPKKYIYLSYAGVHKELAEKVALVLNDQFKTLSKYRFEILTADSIPFGNDMYTTMQENMSKSNIVIIIVSQAYLHSEWCIKEFTTICEKDKLIIPIVTESFADLAKLPKDISNIKALSLINCESEKDFVRAISTLAKDLIKQRND